MNRVYPVGSGGTPTSSIHRSRNLWEMLPREDCGIASKDDWEGRNLFIGCFWALVIELGMAAIAWLGCVLWRVL
jgi:hypothetical protein